MSRDNRPSRPNRPIRPRRPTRTSSAPGTPRRSPLVPARRYIRRRSGGAEARPRRWRGPSVAVSQTRTYVPALDPVPGGAGRPDRAFTQRGNGLTKLAARSTRGDRRGTQGSRSTSGREPGLSVRKKPARRCDGRAARDQRDRPTHSNEIEHLSAELRRVTLGHAVHQSGSSKKLITQRPASGRPGHRGFQGRGESIAVELHCDLRVVVWR